VSKFIKQILLSTEELIGPDTIIVGDLNTPLSSIDRTSRQKINKDILELNNTMGEMILTDIYRVVHPTVADYTYFSVVDRTFCKIDHILGNETNLNKYKKLKYFPVC
jgi:exonuclease III